MSQIDPTNVPPDRGWVLTEQRNPRSMNLHELSARQSLELIHREDHEVLRAIDRAMPSIAALVEAVEPGFASGGRVVYLGAGTSGRLGVLDASEMPPTFQIDPSRFVGIIAGGDGSLRRSSEGREDELLGAVPELEAMRLSPHDAVIGIAAGGTTPYVRGALEWVAARESAQRALAGLIVCSPVPKPSGVEHMVVLETGPEVVTGSTRMKAGTATKLVLNMISTTLMVRSGRVHENLMVDLRASNAKLRDRAARIVSTLTGLSREASLTLLDRGDGRVKTAVVMQRAGVSREEADARLASAGGSLARALGSLNNR